MRRRNWTVPYALFLLVFVIVPLLLIVLYAFTDDGGAFTLANFRKFMMHPEAMNTFVYSIGIAVITTLVCLLLGYPAAYILSQKQFNTSRTMVVLFILPMWVNILIRTLATVALFDFLNLPLGEGALVFGMVYNFLPFMIYPIYNTLQKMDHNLIEAAQDLGASPTRVFGKVILPLSMPGVMSGIVMVFMPKVLGNWTGFSTKLYSSLFTGGMHHSLINAIWNTFAIALLAATASTALGSIAAIGIFNLRSRTRQVMNFANAIPMMNADIITGVSLFLLFVSFGISQGFTTVVLAHITFCTPYVVLSVMPRLKKMNQNVYEAALDLGATPFQALRKVILPEIFPGMISGFILAFTLSIDDFAVTIFTIGNQGLETLSTYIYADARKGGLTPELRPLSTIIFVTVLVLLIVINKRAERTKND